MLKVVKFVIDNRPDSRDINLVYKEKYMLSEQVTMFCDINNISPKIETKSLGVPLTGDHSTLYSLNIELDGLAAGFKEYNKL